jgi:release factor glutamine methyltransferase
MVTNFYEKVLRQLQAHLRVLADKPEESVANTLDALWFAAAGTPYSVEAAVGKDRPLLSKDQEVELHRLIDLRLAGTPLAHITGRQQFMGLELLASPAALIPRKETELLAASAIDILQSNEWEEEPPHVIDLCTGAGNIAIALALSRPNVRVFASDISPGAIELTNKNIELHRVSDRVETRSGDLLEPFRHEEFFGNMDIITCNPPYISSGRVGEMEAEISAHEPPLAFDGGPFGIAIINRLIMEALQFLRTGGWLAFEIGLGQGDSIIKRIEKRKLYQQVIPIRDRGDDIRVILAQC